MKYLLWQLRKIIIKIYPLILLATAIALSPSFSEGMIECGRVIEIRIEDILIVVLELIWIANFSISKVDMLNVNCNRQEGNEKNYRLKPCSTK